MHPSGNDAVLLRSATRRVLVPIILLLIPLAAVFVVTAVRFFELRTQRNTIPGPVHERLSFRLFLAAGGTVLICSLLEFAVRPRLHPIMFPVGCAVAVASFSIRRSAIAALGRFWSLHVEIRESHEFVSSGPFRFVRHPAYFSMLLEVLCVPLLLAAPYSLILAPLIYIPAMLYRVRLEEPALILKFGEPYRDYMTRTPAFIPYRWPHTR